MVCGGDQIMERMPSEVDLEQGKGSLSERKLRTEWQSASSVRAKTGQREDEKSYPWYKYEGFNVHDLRRSAVLAS